MVFGTEAQPAIGRPPGVPNRKSAELAKVARDLGIDPFLFMLHVVAGNWKEIGYDKGTKTVAFGEKTFEIDLIDVNLRFKAAKECCQYLYPKRKAIELSSDGGSPFIAIEKPDGTKMIMGSKKDE